MGEKTIGQTAFEAYTTVKGGLTHDGKRIPPWSEVGDDVQRAWQVSAEEVVAHVPISVDELIRRARRDVEDGPPSRERSMVLTKLDEARLWLTRVA